jgi:SAM-dependent methyltransferase
MRRAPEPLLELDTVRAPDGFPQEAFERLARIEEDHFWFRSRNRLIAWALGQYFPQAARLLEVGCGTGNVLRAIQSQFPAIELVGADVSSEALRIAARRVSADLRQLDAQETSFVDQFDVVCAFDVLEHIDEDAVVLAKLRTATRSGGGLLVTVPQYPWLWSPADDYGRHRRRYTKREIEDKIAGAGFTIVRSTAWVCVLLPAVALSRLWDRRRAQYDAAREFRVSRRANRLLGLVLAAEQVAIERGLTLPFGASRLVVAKKP